MNETDFIELTLRYLDHATSQSEVDRLGAAMLESPQQRTLYRDLVQQSQLSHEAHLASASDLEATPRPPFPVRRLVVIATAAAAAVMLISVLFYLQPDPPPRETTIEVAIEPEPSGFFTNDPSWSDIYRSPFDYPDFVWRAEISASNLGTETLDEFSDGGALAHIAASPSAEFSRLLAPIGLLPSDEDFGSHRY